MPSVEELGMRERLEVVLAGRGVERKLWECGERVEGRCCLVRLDGRWRAGVVERGGYFDRFDEVDGDIAIWEFADWVTQTAASTQASAAATAEWLRRHGEDRP